MSLNHLGGGKLYLSTKIDKHTYIIYSFFSYSIYTWPAVKRKFFIDTFFLYFTSAL